MSQPASDAPLDQASDDQPVIPASTSLPELTVKAIVLGVLLSVVLAGANALSLPWLADAVVEAGSATNGWMAPGLGMVAWGLCALFLFRLTVSCKRRFSAARSAAKPLADHRWRQSSLRQGAAVAATPFARAA